MTETPSGIPKIFVLADAAELMGVSEPWLRAKLRDHTFAGLKRANRWAMTEPQIIAAIETMSTQKREPPQPPPSGRIRRGHRF